MAKEKSLNELAQVKDLGEQDFIQLQKKILRIDISQITVEGFLQPFLENFNDFKSRETIIKNILDKIKIFKAEHENKKFVNVQKLEASCLFAFGEDIYKNPIVNEVKEMKFMRLVNSIENLESVNKISHELKGLGEKEVVSVKNLINEIIINYGDLEEGFRLAQHSLKLRESNFEPSHLNILEALLTLAKLGTESKIYSTKIEGLQSAERTYNLVCKDISQRPDLVVKSLNYMSNIYDSLGDRGKSSELLKQSAYVAKKYELIANQELGEKGAETQMRSLILQKNITDYKVLEIKKLLQENVLNPIQEAAANGKWHDMRLFAVQYGVVGYLEAEFLKKTMDKLYSEENYKIALGLCFEAINIGIMSSSDKNPLTAAVFCKQYPSLIEEIIKTHAEYFVDGTILQTSLINSSLYTEELLGSKIVENAEYNRFFETAMIPFINARLETTILNNIKLLASKGDWSSVHSSTLEGYLAEEYLIKNVLGNNLDKIPDILSIVRVLAFKSLCNGIEESKSVNFASIQKFIELYPELNIRIIENHPEYFIEPLIVQICDKGKKSYINKKLAEIINEKNQENAQLLNLNENLEIEKDEPFESLLSGAATENACGDDVVL